MLPVAHTTWTVIFQDFDLKCEEDGKKVGLLCTIPLCSCAAQSTKIMATYTVLEAVDLLDASFSDSDSEIDEDPTFPTLDQNQKCIETVYNEGDDHNNRRGQSGFVTTVSDT